MDNNSFVLILLSMLAVAVILLLFIKNRDKKQMEMLAQIKQQMEDMQAVPAGDFREEKAEPDLQGTAVAEIIELTEEKQDADAKEEKEVAASAYNTGKSGKIYTKEELELLIKE